MHVIVRIIGFMLILQGFIACDSENLTDTGNPSNLTVELTIPDDSGIVLIQATADHTVEYQLRIGTNDQPVQSNATGYFEHTFPQPGLFQLDIRAYGSSGRYIRELRQVEIGINGGIPPVGQGYSTPLSYPGYQLVWHDEFNETAINPDYWVFETGTGCPNLCGWGNNELQFYRRENARVEQDVLIIEAKKENYSGSLYTSSRMKTQGKKSFRYGRIDIRALLPKGQGIWPALWMLGNDITTVGWPKCGEIDIMEMIGGDGRENSVHGTVHWDLNGHVQAGGSFTKQSGTFADEYHVFTIIWDETAIRWFVNDAQYYTIDITPDHMTEFHQPHFFLFNIAVGGNWPGNPDASTVFHQQMRVDYIRVFQEI